jgi:TPR repeat protein
MLTAIFLTSQILIPANAQVTEAPADAVPSTEEDLARGLTAYNAGDLIGAMAIYRKAADAGSTEAKVRLAWILDQSEDNAGALQLYKQAAAAGDPAGQFGLAEFYANGEGVERDLRRAVKLFTEAANKGHKRAMLVLATAYTDGSLGVPPSERQADYWRDKLAEAERAETQGRQR